MLVNNSFSDEEKNMLTEVDIERIMAAKLRFYETVFENENYDFLHDEALFETLSTNADIEDIADNEHGC